MSSNIGPMIAASARLGLGYAERLLKDVKPDQFGRFAKIGDTVIINPCESAENVAPWRVP